MKIIYNTQENLESFKLQNLDQIFLKICSEKSTSVN